MYRIASYLLIINPPPAFKHMKTVTGTNARINASRYNRIISENYLSMIYSMAC